MKKIFLLLTLVFAPIAAIMAFLITYEEYLHHYPDKKVPFRKALEAAIFTFFIFAALMALVSLFFD